MTTQHNNYSPWVEPRRMRPAQIGNDGNERGLGPFLAILALAVAVQIRQYLQRFVLTERVDTDDHIGPPSGARTALALGIGRTNVGAEGGASADALLEGFEAKHVEKELVEGQPERGGAKVVEPIPQEAVFGHDLVRRHVLVVGEGSVVGVDVDNVDGELGRVQDVEGVAEGVGRGAMSSAGVRHENLNGVRRNIFRGRCGGAEEGGAARVDRTAQLLLLFNNLLISESGNGAGGKRRCHTRRS